MANQDPTNLFYLPQYRDSLMDRITNAYFKRDEPASPSPQKSIPKKDREIIVDNAAVRLYKNAEIRMNKKKKESEIYEKRRVSEELKKCSFRPKISRSAISNDKLQKLRRMVGTNELLFADSKGRQKRLDKLQLIRDHEISKHLKEKPTINRLSKKIDAMKFAVKLAESNSKMSEIAPSIKNVMPISKLIQTSFKKKKRTKRIDSALLDTPISKTFSTKQYDRNIELHEESKTREKKLQRLQSSSFNYREKFTPKTNEKKKRIGEKSFFERIEEFNKRKKDHIDKVKIEQERKLKFDEKTGQRFFKPITNTDISANLNSSYIKRQSTSQGLYRLNKSMDQILPENISSKSHLKGSVNSLFPRPYSSKEHSVLEKIESKRGDKLIDRVNALGDNAARSKPRFPHPPKPNRKPAKELSDKLLNRRLEQSIREVFAKLDDDQDGEINAENISIEDINTKQLKTISPILFELEELNQTLDYTEFKAAIMALLAKEPPQCRYDFVFGEKKKEEAEYFPFKVIFLD